jgi:hypothetical protein
MKTFLLAAICAFAGFTGSAAVHGDTFSVHGFQGNYYGR